jgi:hypothetical protein
VQAEKTGDGRVRGDTMRGAHDSREGVERIGRGTWGVKNNTGRVVRDIMETSLNLGSNLHTNFDGHVHSQAQISAGTHCC